MLLRNRYRIANLSIGLFGFFAFIFIRRFLQVPWVLLEYYDVLKLDESTDACVMPRVDPFDPTIKDYVWISKRLTCKEIQPDFVVMDDNGTIWLNRTLAELNGFKHLRCNYRCFRHNSGVDDDTLKYDEWTQFKDLILVTCEFIEVVCKKSLNTLPVYSYVFTNVMKKRKINREITNSSIKSSDATDRLSVLILSVDSMSRSNMIRQMPKSVDFLEKTLHGVTLEGFTKIGDNTWVNLLAILTGLRAFPTNEFPADLSTFEEQYFDNYAEYIWKNFSRSGYATLFVEDRPDIQDFNYGVRKGFRYQPTDHYDRPMWLAMWWSFVHMRSSAFCYNSLPEHKFMFDYVRKFVKAYKNDPSFGIMWWQNLSHDFLNKISSADEDFVEFLQSLIPYLNRTVLFVLSDHGHRYDTIRQTVIGRVEARMPYATVVVPAWFRQKYSESYKNLKRNSLGGLTTPFDVYSTLADILHRNFDNSDLQGASRRKRIVPEYALSLFESIPAKRNCKIARVPEEYCPCYVETELKAPTNDRRVSNAADRLLVRINEILTNHRPPCVSLRLAIVRSAFVFLFHQGTMQDVQVGKKIPKSGFYVSYRVVIETTPGGALFEGVVKYSVDKDDYSVDGDIDRNSAYGNSSACVKEILLRKFCFCV